ncbi:MAG TPA: hypothetical protein VFY76_19640 [Nocardioides sp.]|nr:hypothetical protein [Nocardioides sp.]
MNQFTHVARRLVAGAVVALAMTVGLTSFTVAGSSAAVTSGKSVVGKSDAGKITSTVVGKTSAGDKVGGSFTPIKVIERDGVMYVKGFLRGVIKDAGPNTTFSGVQNIPIKKINGSPLVDGRIAANAAACDILNLVLGPLDLNILGLRVQLNQVVLDITAVPGAGNLLGNLLCAVAGLLDGTPLAGLLGQLQTLLNQILAALNLGV